MALLNHTPEVAASHFLNLNYPMPNYKARNKSDYQADNKLIAHN